MDEIEYKLNTNNSVLVVNAIDKLISTIKFKFKPGERQKFVLENEELKLLRDKCSSKEVIVSLTACQGLLALVELGVLEIAHTMSTVVTLLPSAHNYSAIISTMTGLLILDLKSRLVPGQPYRCQFSLKSPQHPFITVLERNKGAEDDVLVQMQALCTHPDYIVSSNSLELLRPVFLYLTCNPRWEGSIRPWQLLLSLPKTDAQCSLLLACLSCQQICSPTLIERAFSAYSAVADAAIYQKDEEYVTALVPMLARISNELVKHGRDPRPCYHLLERCFSLGAARLRAAAGLALQLLSANLPMTSALYLHDTFNLCLNIISKYEVPSISLNAFVAQSLQWLHLPSYLTTSALKVAAKILDTYRESTKEDTALNIPNILSNKIFQSLLYTDSHLSVIVKLHSVWERLRDDESKLSNWLAGIECIHDSVKVDLLPFFYGMIMEKNRELGGVGLKVLRMVVKLVDYKKDVAVELLPILVYKLANDVSPAVRLECLRAVPLMAKTKENVPAIVSVLNKLKANKGVPTSLLIMLYCSLAETQVRCFPYLQEMLVEPGAGRPDDLKWEVEIAKICAAKRMCELRASSHGLELVSLISGTLNRCVDRGGSAAACVALQSIALLWRHAALQPHSAWRALDPKLARDTRQNVLVHMCKLLAEIPPLHTPSPEFCLLAASACRRLWRLVPAADAAVSRAACRALAAYSTEHYVLRDVPEIYRKTVKLPASFCKTPVDAARKPEDVLEYVPCEVWPEVFKHTHPDALPGVVEWMRKLFEREVKGYRSGVYHVDGKETTSLGHLPPHSAVRGVMESFRKQVVSPAAEYSPAVTLAMAEALCGELPRPLPPTDLLFLAAGCARGGAPWRLEALTLAARQAKVSPSGKAIIESWLLDIETGTAPEQDIILFFELLPTLTRSLSPNTLRLSLETCLADGLSLISQKKAKEDYATTVLKQIISKNATPSSKSESPSKESTLSAELSSLSHESEDEELFVKQLKLIKKCLDSEIHDANRTLLSQFMEQYFVRISDDNVSWPTFVQTCRSLSAACLERMTSPSGWWQVTPELLRKAAAVRSALAAAQDSRAPLLWLNELIDAQAQRPTEQETSLSYMLPALIAADPSANSTQEWFLQLMARTQVAFNESSDSCVVAFLFSVFALGVVSWSGQWSLEAAAADLLRGSAAAARLPAAAPAAARALHDRCTPQMVEWLWHSGARVRGAAREGCQRALLAMRHTDHFSHHNVWTKLESHFGRDIVDEI